MVGGACDNEIDMAAAHPAEHTQHTEQKVRGQVQSGGVVLGMEKAAIECVGGTRSTEADIAAACFAKQSQHAEQEVRVCVPYQ